MLTFMTMTLLSGAQVGAEAPAFTLTDLNGKPVELSDYRGKTVVLEWFNPQCPYVVAAHTKGSLTDTARRHTKRGVVWLAINSGAKGRQGWGAEVNAGAASTFGMGHPILIDESGKVGRAYGATNTPQMFIVDGKGKVVYAGAIDNAPDGAGEMPSGGKLINYVDQALRELAAGKKVSTPVTRPYGCTVKYSS